MKRTAILSFTLMAFVFLAATAGLAGPGKPNFSPAVYADGKVFGTKGTTVLPPPNGHNEQSFDALYIITNSNNSMGQLPVAEAAPGNPYYNGGRWATKTVEWTEEGFAAHGTVPVLMSYDEIAHNYDIGYLEIFDEPPPGPNAPPDYFQCPLLPVK